MSNLRIVATALIASVVLAWPAMATAQEDASGVVALLTETVDMTGDRPSSAYWWQQPDSPQWTRTDNLLRERLRDEGISVFTPAGETRISKIYRRPNLSLANASTLAELMNGDRLVVGHVRYTQEGTIGPIASAHVSAKVTLTMTRAGQSAVEAGHTVELVRHGYALEADDALDSARKQLVDAISQAIRNTVSTGPGRVGWDAGERLIGLRGVGTDSRLEQIKTFLTGLEGVSRVDVRWAGQGIIALELNPGNKDTPDTIEYAIRALANQTFEEFTLYRQPQPVAEGLAEFLVSEPMRPESP